MKNRLDCRLVLLRWFAFRCTLVLITIIGAKLARGEKLRVGLIEPIDGYAVPMELLPELQNKLVAVDCSGGLGNVVHLSPCQPLPNSNQYRVVQGVCGRPVSLPETWPAGSDLHFYRGVVNGPNRPGTATRKQLIGQPPEPWGNLRHLLDSCFPNDVIAVIDKANTLHLGCDWDADLSISEEERFTLTADELDRPKLFQCGDAIVLIQAPAKPLSDTDSEPAGHLEIHLWTVTGTAQDSRRSSNQSPLSALLDPSALPDPSTTALDCELVWLDVGGLMPADLAAAMHAASDLECDVVLANVDSSSGSSTDIAQLLAELSHTTKVPVVVNQRTTVSPNFLVHPARTSIPDLAEFRFTNEPGTFDAFGRRVQELFSDPTPLKQVKHESLGTDVSMHPDALFDHDQVAIGAGRFVAIDQSQFVLARVPFDAIDGRLKLGGQMILSPLSDLPNIRLYDVRGRRISGLDHGNGIRIDRAPPMEVALARGGYVIAPREFFWMGKTWTLTDPNCLITWTTGMNPIHETDHQQRIDTETIRVIGDVVLPDTLAVSDRMQLARLTGHQQSEVPDAVRRAASHLLKREPLVRSWWYHAAPRNGSIDYRPVFQEVGDQLPTWDDSHLQYWTITESGWLEKRSGRMGDLGLSTTQASWILLQTVSLPSSPTAAPQLVQSVAALDTNSKQIWKRTFHESRMLDQGLPSQRSVWVDEFQGSTSTRANDQADILWSAVHATAQPDEGQPLRETGPAIRWLRSRIAKSPPSDQQRDWLWYYDHDATAESLQQSLLTGSTPAEILQWLEKPGEASIDLVAWRRHLLALDHPLLRKQHLDQVIATAEKVLQLCAQQLGGLPSPEDPYRRELEATMGSGGPGSPASPDPASQHPILDTPTKVQLYAWAADAAYRKVRAIGYRELPDVLIQHPIKDQEAQDRAFEAAFKQLCGIVNIRDHRFALTLVRYERRRGRPSKAYDVLWRDACEGPAMPWYFKKERDLWTDVGWEPLRRLGHARWFLREANQPVMH